MRSIKKVVVLGANGAMGSGSSAVFAAAGIPTVLLARTADKAAAAVARADQWTKGRTAPGVLTGGTYNDLAPALADADLILECVAEDAPIKRAVYAMVDQLHPDAIIATVSSGLPIADLCSDFSALFRAHFLGVHLFNPPTIIVGCELIPHAHTDPGALAIVRDFLTSACGREVVECADRPAFAGNRLGFKLLNEVAQLAEEHGVAYMDRLVGAHTGRALAPLATIDLVGWDVHKAIVDNLHARTYDTAHDAFALPAYMQAGIDRGHLGRKTRDRGGFFRVDKTGGATKLFELLPATGEYHAVDASPPASGSLVARMQAALRTGGHTGAMDVLCRASGRDAELLRRILLGYISYGFGLVGDVVARPRDIDRIMSFGFNWAPPGLLVDAIGAARAVELLAHAQLAVPAPVLEAARHGRAVFDEPAVDRARFFQTAA